MQQRTVRVAGVVGVTVALAVGAVALGLAASNTASSASAARVGTVCELGVRSSRCRGPGTPRRRRTC